MKIDVVELARKGRGLFAPYSDWEVDSSSSHYAAERDFVIAGKNDLKGWLFSYSDGRIRRMVSPRGAEVLFEYDGSGGLLSLVSQGTRFVELSQSLGRVRSLTVNGTPVSFAYGHDTTVVLPKTEDGRKAEQAVETLSSVRIARLEPERFAYRDGYLSQTTRGSCSEKFTLQEESLADRMQNLHSRDPKNKTPHTGRVVGRLVSDGSFTYAYPSKTTVVLSNAAKGTATYDYDSRNGTFRVVDFSGRATTTYYFMRYDAACLGKVRKIVDGRGRDIVAFRYDKLTGKPVRVTDRLGNKCVLEYDADGNCVQLSRRADWSPTEEPVRAFGYNRLGLLASVSELDEDGKPVRETIINYDKTGRPVFVSDGRCQLRIACSRSGFPSEIKSDFVSTSFVYDRYNRLISSTDANGVVTRRTYADHGALAKIECLDGAGILSSVEVGYDTLGRPVSVTDQDGCVTACDRDALGRIVKEKYANETEVAYAYDNLGRLSSVLDENGHELKFGWDKFGLSTRQTAANQLTETKRDANGLVSAVTASKDGKTDRTIRREYDAFDRVTRIAYGNDEVETFAYDKWGRISEHTRGKLKETYAYDYFGRLAEKDENGLVCRYAYNAYGQRTSMTTIRPDGGTTDEKRVYDQHGRLAVISSFGKAVKYFYDGKGRVARQVVDDTPIDFTYTKYGQLAGKYLGGVRTPGASVTYEYSKSGQLVARTANGVRQVYEYDGRGQLLAVKDADGKDLERYCYDKAGNMLKKTVNGRITTFTFDGANQLVSSTTDGVTTKYAYDAAGRLVKEGGKAYRYGYLDKVFSITEGDKNYSYAYHADGQLAGADYGDKSETFEWDGLALVKRGDECFINEPHIGGGNPVYSTKGVSYFNDMLGTTVGAKKGRKYSAAALTAFGEGGSNHTFFTGKPQVEGLGHAFLMRNYRAGLAKWQTADPMGYPDGWNQLAYCGNVILDQIDFMGAEIATGSATWNWQYKNQFKDIWTGFSMVLTCNIFEVSIKYHVIVASGNIPVIVVDSIDEKFQCNTSDSWSLNQDIPITVGGVTVNVGAGTGYNYRVQQSTTDPTYWSDFDYNYVSLVYKFDIYSYNWVSIVGYDLHFFDNLESWTSVELIGKCRKE